MQYSITVTLLLQNRFVVNGKQAQWNCQGSVSTPECSSKITPSSVVGSGGNSNSSKLLCMSSLPARMKKIRTKMKALEWPQHFSNYTESVEIFPDVQGQLTTKSVVGSSRISNRSEILWLSSFIIPARMKKIQSKVKTLEWSQHYNSIFKTLNRSKLRNQWSDLAEIQTHLSLVICKNKEDQFKNKDGRVVTMLSTPAGRVKLFRL